MIYSKIRPVVEAADGRANIFGIAYRVDIVERSGKHPQFDVTVGAISDISDMHSDLYWLDTLRFDLPPSDRFLGASPGVSEVFGLLGGVADEYQRACSEQVERALGDILTCVLCSILDELDEPVGSPPRRPREPLLALLGPPLPKVVGRFLSVRAPADVGIVWVCPASMPRCLGDEILEFSARSATPRSLQGESDDGRHNLLASISAKFGDGDECWLHALDTYRTGADAARSVREAPWVLWCADEGACTLPKQIVLAIDLVCQRAAVGPQSTSARAWRPEKLNTAAHVARLADAARETDRPVFEWTYDGRQDEGA